MCICLPNGKFTFKKFRSSLCLGRRASKNKNLFNDISDEDEINHNEISSKVNGLNQKIDGTLDSISQQGHYRQLSRDRQLPPVPDGAAPDLGVPVQHLSRSNVDICVAIIADDYPASLAHQHLRCMTYSPRKGLPPPDIEQNNVNNNLNKNCCQNAEPVYTKIDSKKKKNQNGINNLACDECLDDNNILRTEYGYSIVKKNQNNNNELDALRKEPNDKSSRDKCYQSLQSLNKCDSNLTNQQQQQPSPGIPVRQYSPYELPEFYSKTGSPTTENCTNTQSTNIRRRNPSNSSSGIRRFSQPIHSSTSIIKSDGDGKQLANPKDSDVLKNLQSHYNSPPLNRASLADLRDAPSDTNSEKTEDAVYSIPHKLPAKPQSPTGQSAQMNHHHHSPYSHPHYHHHHYHVPPSQSSSPHKSSNSRSLILPDQQQQHHHQSSYGSSAVQNPPINVYEIVDEILPIPSSNNQRQIVRSLPIPNAGLVTVMAPLATPPRTSPQLSPQCSCRLMKDTSVRTSTISSVPPAATTGGQVAACGGGGGGGGASELGAPMVLSDAAAAAGTNQTYSTLILSGATPATAAAATMNNNNNNNSSLLTEPPSSAQAQNNAHSDVESASSNSNPVAPFLGNDNYISISDNAAVAAAAANQHSLLHQGTPGGVGVGAASAVIEKPYSIYTYGSDVYAEISDVYPYRQYDELVDNSAGSSSGGGGGGGGGAAVGSVLTTAAAAATTATTSSSTASAATGVCIKGDKQSDYSHKYSSFNNVSATAHQNTNNNNSTSDPTASPGTLRVLLEIQSFRHMDSDVDVSASRCPTPLHPTTQNIFGSGPFIGSSTSTAVASGTNNALLKRHPWFLPPPPLPNNNNNNSSLSSVQQRDNSTQLQASATGVHRGSSTGHVSSSITTKATMTPVMERSMEGSSLFLNSTANNYNYNNKNSSNNNISSNCTNNNNNDNNGSGTELPLVDNLYELFKHQTGSSNYNKPKKSNTIIYPNDQDFI